jgi:hypothetical protein
MDTTDNPQEEKYLVDTDGETSALLAPVNNELSYLNPAEMPNLDEAEAGFSLEATYKKFVITGEIFRAVFNGFTTIRKNENGQIVPMTAAVLQNKDGLFLNSTSNILDQLQRVPAGTAVQITYQGDQKTTSGYNVKKFEIRILNVARTSVPAQPASAAVTRDIVTEAKPAMVTPAWIVNNGYAVNAKDDKGRIAEASNMLNLLGLVGKSIEYAEPKIVTYIAWRESGLDTKAAAAEVIAGHVLPF